MSDWGERAADASGRVVTADATVRLWPRDCYGDGGGCAVVDKERLFIRTEEMRRLEEVDLMLVGVRGTGLLSPKQPAWLRCGLNRHAEQLRLTDARRHETRVQNLERAEAMGMDVSSHGAADAVTIVELMQSGVTHGRAQARSLWGDDG